MNDVLNIYVANLGKYNEGELVGGWISLPTSEDEIVEFLVEQVGVILDPVEAHERMLAGERVYEGYAIHDYESEFFKVDEYDDIYQLNEKAEAISELNPYEEKTLKAAVEWMGSEALEQDLDDFVLLEGVHSDYDLGYYWIVESGCYDLGDSVLSRYSDYESFGRDVYLESNGYYTSYGYIELR